MAHDIFALVYAMHVPVGPVSAYRRLEEMHRDIDMYQVLVSGRLIASHFVKEIIHECSTVREARWVTRTCL